MHGDPPAITYDQTGDYEVVLKVFGTEGRVDSTSSTISVSERDRPDLLIEQIQVEDELGIDFIVINQGASPVFRRAINEGENVAFRVLVFNGGSLTSTGFELEVFLDVGMCQVE